VEGFALFHAAHIPSEHGPAGSLQVALPKRMDGLAERA
jgi:hypothetical protein